MKTRILLFFITFFVAAIFSVTAQNYNDYFEKKTLRFDYIHSGTQNTESIKMVKLKEEPFWGGSLKNLIDTFGYGRYYFTLTDLLSGDLIYSRGFSTLFVEWQDTEEAKNGRCSFNESLVMPFPKSKSVLKIYSRDKFNKLHLIYTYLINPKKVAKYKGGNKKGWETQNIMVHGDPSEKLDIVFLAEGYTSEEIKKFWSDSYRFAEYLINASPFKEHKENINIRAVGSISKDSGISYADGSSEKSTVLGSSFNTFNSDRYLMAEDFHKVRDVAGLVPYDQIFIIANSDKYGGGGIFNFYSIGTAENNEGAFLLIHEFGHAFAGLADEYYTSDVAVESFYDLETEPWEPNITTLINFASKWKDLIEINTPIPTPAISEYESKVGVFEGAGYSATGVYRPFQECTMKSVIYDGFCPVCQRAISRMIDFYSTSL